MTAEYNNIEVYISFLRKTQIYQCFSQNCHYKNVGYSLGEVLMVRKIRLKFVTITLSLLTVTFTVIFLTNYMYNFYLDKGRRILLPQKW